MIRQHRIHPVLLTMSLMAAALLPLHAQVPLLSLEFNSVFLPGFQAPPLPEAGFNGDIATPSNAIGIGDFGTTGYLVVPQFKTPTGPFTVEAGFQLGDYGNDSATYSSVLLNASEGGHGFSLRVGGGPRYPIRPGTNLVHPSIWAQSEDSTARHRSLVSSCVGAFSMQGPDGKVLEAYTRTCLQIGEWVNLTATWDGTSIHLYVNGEEQTDPNRMVGFGLLPLRPDHIPVYVGVQDASGARHFKGRMDFVRVLEGALKGEAIQQRYNESGRAEDPAYDCQGAVTVRPIVVQGACDLTYSKLTLGANDSLELEYSGEWDFKTILNSYRVPVKFFRYFDHSERGNVNAGRLFWRARIIRGPVVVIPKDTTPVVVVPKDTTPVVVVPKDTTPVVSTPKDSIPKVTTPVDSIPRIPTRIFDRTLAWSGSGAILVPYLAGAELPSLHRLDGARIPAMAVRIGAGWELRPRMKEPGLILLRHHRPVAKPTGKK